MTRRIRTTSQARGSSMPLHDVGYRPWTGKRNGRWAAAGVIATTGIRLAWSGRWLRRMVLFGWSPALVFATSFFAFEQAIDEGRFATMQEAARAGRNLDGVGMLGPMLADTLGRIDGGRKDAAGADVGSRHAEEQARIAATRRVVWARLLLAFMRVPQAVLLAVVVGLVAPTLVSRDLRAKAWLVYFTRPVGRAEYLVGKCLIMATLVCAITVLPAVALWLLGVLVSPSVWVAVDTWDLPLKAVAASIVLAVPTVLLSLAYSSLTAESRIASFAWFATWAACWIAHSSLTTADLVAAARRADAAATAEAGGFASPFQKPTAQNSKADRSRDAPRSRGKFQWLKTAAGIDDSVDRWAWLSPYHALGVLQAAIFGMETRSRVIVPPLVSLAVVSAVSLLVLLNRIDAPTRA
jgi:ABC-2 type transport system permease protein